MGDLNADDKERFLNMMEGMSKEGQEMFLNLMANLDAKQKVQMVRCYTISFTCSLRCVTVFFCFFCSAFGIA
jgi:hypothetical protein